ncbi:MAG: AMMECR1 domain-containing protein, partial [Caldimicrobium sp.]
AKPEEVEVGKHGIFLKKGPFRGLLLPQVATEYNWDRNTFLRQGCLKAGLSENCWEDPETELYLFTAEVFSEREIF